jgi:hypothetical protein
VSDTTRRDVEWLLAKLTDGAQNPVAGDGKCDVHRSVQPAFFWVDIPIYRLSKCCHLIYRFSKCCQLIYQFSNCHHLIYRLSECQLPNLPTVKMSTSQFTDCQNVDFPIYRLSKCRLPNFPTLNVESK